MYRGYKKRIIRLCYLYLRGVLSSLDGNIDCRVRKVQGHLKAYPKIILL